MLKSVRQILAGAILLLASLPLSAQIRTEDKDSLVRLMSAESAQMIVERGVSYRKVFGPAKFLHNNTYLICDTALWNVDRGLIKATGHVKILQDQTELTGDYLDYFIDDNLAQFRGGVVQLKDKDNNTLRTSYLDYNTKDSVAIFEQGGAMRDKDGQVIESLRGSYDAKIKKFVFEHDVNMFTDSVFVKTSKLEYSSPESEALFGFNTNAWKEDNMLSADAGWYKRNEELFFFTRKVHLLTDTQEGWCDSLYFKRETNQVDMFGNAEVADTSRRINALAGHIAYSDSLQQVEMFRSPNIRSISGEEGQLDTTYIAGEYFRYRTIPRCEIDSMEVVQSGQRLTDIMSDPVREYRRKAAEAAEKARQEAQAKKDEEEGVPQGVGRGKGKSSEEGASKPPENAPPKPPENAPPKPPEDAPKPPAAAPDTLAGRPSVPDSLAKAPSLPDSLAAGPSLPDSLSTERMMPDSLGMSPSLPDSLATSPVDSLALEVPSEPKDSTKVGFVSGHGRVRIFRRDIQARCDSLAFTELDSIMRMYRDPVIWNEGNRQYTSDSIAVLIRGEALDRASLMSNAFIAVEEDSLHYDQIKSAEMLAFFDEDGGLKRFDALGGANALFYLEENETLATVNVVDTKMMSVQFREGELERINYFESVKNDAYPVVQLPKESSELKGFAWRGDEKPSDPTELMPVPPRKSQRKVYESRPRARFTYTDKYFPGYMAKVNKKLADDKARREQRRREKAERDRLAADSLALADTLSLKDSLDIQTPESPSDSLSTASQPDTLSSGKPVIPGGTGEISRRDSTTVAPPEVKEPTPEEIKAAEKAAAKAEKERLRREKEAEREAKWARLDSLDKAKAAAKEQKRRDKIRRRNEKILRKEAKRLEREERLYQKYLARYQRKKEKEEARAAAKASKKDDETPRTNSQQSTE